MGKQVIFELSASISQKTVGDRLGLRSKLLLMANRKLHMPLSIGTKNDDLELLGV